MSQGNKNFDLEQGREVAAEFGRYIQRVSELVADMQTAANACHEQLADDTLSVEAVDTLNANLKAVRAAVQEAIEVRGKLLQKIQRTEELISSKRR